MTPLINLQNNTPPLLPLTGGVSETPRLSSSEDFISNAISIVKISAQNRDFDQIDMPLKALIKKYPKEVMSSETCHMLVQQIKDSRLLAEDLPTIYRHLLLDIQFETDPDNFVSSNFLTYNEEFRIECAKLAAQKKPIFSVDIKKYGITNQRTLVDIAKLAAKKNGTLVSKHIQNYGITSQDALVEIAKLAVEKNSEGASIHIQNYRITNQKALVDIAKIAAQKDGEGLSKYIQNYGITSQEALVEIANLAAEQDGKETSRYIQNYKIKSQSALLEIATLAFKKNGLEALFLFTNYNLDPINRATLMVRFVNAIPEIMQNIAAYFPEKDRTAVLKQYPELRILGINDDFVSEYFYFFKNNNFPTSFSDKRTDLYLDMIGETDPGIKALKTNMLRAFCSILDFSDGSPSLLEKFDSLFNSIKKGKDLHIQEQKLGLIAALLMHCRARNVDKTALEEQLSLLNEVFDLKDPALRFYMSNLLVDNLTNPVLCDFINKNLIGVKLKDKQCATADLALVLLAPLITKMASYVELEFAANKTHILDENPEIREVSFIQRMQDLLNHSYFQRDRMKTKSLLRNLRTLVDTPQLSNTQKTSILHDLIFTHDLILIKDKHFSKNQYREQLLHSAEIVSLLINLNEIDRLTSISSEQLPNQIPELFERVLKIDVPDFNKRVLNTFATWRKPNALLSYAGNLQSLPEIEREQVMPLLKKYTESVLKGTFASTRYDLSPINASEHWLKIHEKAPPALLAEWKKGSRDAAGMFEVVDTDDPCDLLLSGTEVGSCQSVDGVPDLSKCLTAYLMDPKIRMMAVKNKNGETVARCMMRLLWDKKAKEFVLFQEKKYPNGCSSSFAKMLDSACKKRAEKLRVALLVKDEDAHGNDVTTLQAFKGKAPFEYVDAHDEDHIQTDAGYEIGRCKYIYRPQNF